MSINCSSGATVLQFVIHHNNANHDFFNTKLLKKLIKIIQEIRQDIKQKFIDRIRK